MSVAKKDIWIMGSANMQETDTGTQGGAIDKTVKVTFADTGTTSTYKCYSSGTDTSTEITVTGRDAAGSIVSEAETLTGTTGAETTQTFERILKAVITSGTPTDTCAAISTETPSASGTAQNVSADSLVLASGGVSSNGDYKGEVVRITSSTDGTGELAEILDSDAGNDTIYIRQWGTLPTGTIQYEINPGVVFERYSTPNIDIGEVRRPFYDTTAPATGDNYYYEKIFAYNSHGSTDLTNAQIKEVSTGIYDKIEFDLEDALDDNDTAANRTADPNSGYYVYDNADKDVVPAGTHTLTHEKGQGVWLKLSLASTASATNSFYEMTVAGQSV